MSRRKKSTTILLIIGAVVALGCLAPVGFMAAVFADNRRQWAPDKLEQSQLAAEPLIAAIERYRGAVGEHPESLEQLVPDYISAIPTPPAGAGEFYFTRRNDGEYVLAIGQDWDRWSRPFVLVGYSYEYHSDSDAWYLLD